MPIIYPSLISADQLNILDAINQLDPHVVGYHLDVMDNHFVPNLTWGAPTVNAIAHVTQRVLWVHLMVTDPAHWLDNLTLAPNSIISFHYEAAHAESMHIITSIKQKNWRASIAINPDTSIEIIVDVLSHVDQVLVMSVQPGFSGQSFIVDVVKKVDALVAYRAKHGLSFRIAMDGGINENNIEMLAQKGVDDFAIASGIFAHADMVRALEMLNQKINQKK